MKTTQSMKQICITFMALRESETSVNGTRRATRYLIIWQSMNGASLLGHSFNIHVKIVLRSCFVNVPQNKQFITRTKQFN